MDTDKLTITVIEERKEDQYVKIALAGQSQVSDHRHLKDALRPFARYLTVVLDLKELTFADSTFFAVVISIAERRVKAKLPPLTALHASQNIQYTAHVTGIASLRILVFDQPNLIPELQARAAGVMSDKSEQSDESHHTLVIRTREAKKLGLAMAIVINTRTTRQFLEDVFGAADNHDRPVWPDQIRRVSLDLTHAEKLSQEAREFLDKKKEEAESHGITWEEGVRLPHHLLLR